VRIGRLIAAFALLGTLAATIGPPSASATVTRPTLSQLQNLISQSVGVNAPDLLTTIPAQSQVGYTDYGRVPSACFSRSFSVGVPANAQRRCAFGDQTSPRRILVFGDDVALEWLPALSQLGTDLHWRIIFLGKPECSAWNYRAAAGTVACRAYIHHVVEFANRLHARYVFPMGNKVAWHGNKDASVKQLRYEIGATIDAMRPSQSRVILFEAIPQFNPGYTDWTPNVCFTKYYNNMAVCENVIHNFAVTSTASLAIYHLAIVRKLHVVPAMPLFCSSTKCALFVTTPNGTYLVYRDAMHMSRYYSNFIARALEDELSPLLH